MFSRTDPIEEERRQQKDFRLRADLIRILHESSDQGERRALPGERRLYSALVVGQNPPSQG